MTPDEIRQHSEATFDQIREGLDKRHNPESVKLSTLMHIMQALWEIAAQLSERTPEKERKES